MNDHQDPLYALSPTDGRYLSKTHSLRPYFSEAALMQYRCEVEVEYFIALLETGVIRASTITELQKEQLRSVVKNFNLEDALFIKKIESQINHDVKAIEYFLKEKLEKFGLGDYQEWIHFGLTSQDINNSAFPLMIRHSYQDVLIPTLKKVRESLYALASETKDIPMLAHTHGQPASPTRFGKEIMVYVDRLDRQILQLHTDQLYVKFGGATGNFNAHTVAFPDIDWNDWADRFTNEYLKMGRYTYTTQIEPYDQIAALCHATMRINTILMDACKDFWTYISMQYLKQKANPDEVGSSAMPHKVNPIDFENAEGNLGYANAIFSHLADKLPVSRLQRDLTDSTVLRNIGVPIAHTLISLQSLIKGLQKIEINPDKLLADLNANWAVLAEAIQTILRSEGVDKPYERLKDLTRGKSNVTSEDLKSFIQTLPVSDEVKSRLNALTPDTYTGQVKPY